MKRNKDKLKQILRDVKTSNETRAEKLEADLKRAREAIEMVLRETPDDHLDIYEVVDVELSCDQVQMLKDALK
jgi:short-subunit dehydrogenase